VHVTQDAKLRSTAVNWSKASNVFFIDIVGCSKLLINEQSDQIQELKQSHAKENSFAWLFNWLPLT